MVSPGSISTIIISVNTIQAKLIILDLNVSLLSGGITTSFY